MDKYTLAPVGTVKRAIARNGAVIAVCDSTINATLLLDELRRQNTVQMESVKALVERLREDEITWSAAALTRQAVINRLDGILADDPQHFRIMLTIETPGDGFAQREVTPGAGTEHVFFGDSTSAVKVKVDWA